MQIDDKRRAEHAKYECVYATNPKYRMKEQRKADAVRDLAALPCRGSYLDVSCGRGEMLENAGHLGFQIVHGTEIVPALIDGERILRAEVHALPFGDKSFDVVSMFDVIEHLIPGDDQAACREMARVARSHILITANNKPSTNKATGEDLHINKRPYEEWDALFRKWFHGSKVTWIKGPRSYVSEAWRIDL